MPSVGLTGGPEAPRAQCPVGEDHQGVREHRVSGPEASLGSRQGSQIPESLMRCQLGTDSACAT
eukprot:1737821-Pyramimonas_sp.AAC.1